MPKKRIIKRVLSKRGAKKLFKQRAKKVKSTIAIGNKRKRSMGSFDLISKVRKGTASRPPKKKWTAKRVAKEGGAIVATGVVGTGSRYAGGTLCLWGY